MTETQEKNVVLFVDERGILKKSAHSSKALQVWHWSRFDVYSPNARETSFLELFAISVIFISLTNPMAQKDFVFKKLKSSPPQILIFYKS